MPAVFGGLPDVEVYVTGDAAYTLDVVGFYEAGMPQVFLFVLGLSFLLLLVAFHSIVIPIKAILLNLLSTGAAYGLMVLVFQDGHGAALIDVKPGVIEAFVPVFIFTILFGLSMDYHVFILTRIKEARDHGLSSNAAVERGISITAGTVTSAAVIMVAVFAVFVTLRLSIIKQLGFGLAVAVLLDATIIRSVLLPASMRLLGDWNWWMPGFLQLDPPDHHRGRDRGRGFGGGPGSRRRGRSGRADAARGRAGRRMSPDPASTGAATDAALDDLPDHVRRNRAMWDEWATEYVANGERSWRLGVGEETWGIWDIAEADLHLLPDDLTGLDTIELGCGTAYVSAWLARRGARPVGIDNSAEQLATARRLQAEHGLDFPLHHGNAEAVPYPDASFDLAISEYGASIWADPYRWIPEASRLLRPGGRLLFLVNGLILVLAMHDEDEDDVPADDRLRRPYFGLHRLEWKSDDSVNFALGYGDWIRLLRANDFEVEDLVELQAPEGATTTYPFVTSDWAHRWPSEEVWVARKRG